MMRILGTTTAVVASLLAVPSASFTLPSSHRFFAAGSAGVSVVDTQDDAFISIKEDDDKATSYYDPSDAFEDEIHLAIEDLKEENLLHLEEDCEEEEVEQAYDITRDLDGFPLSKDYFAEKMGLERVDSYTCPEQDAFRGFMSNGCRVHLEPGGETAFYKRIVFGDIEHCQEKFKNAPFKLQRDAKSAQVVASWLSSQACKDVAQIAGVHVPHCYDVQMRPNPANPMESKFNFLLEDFSPSQGWYQSWLLDSVEECQVTLSTYAKIHAFFWHGSRFWNDQQAAQELEAAVWESGSYVQPEAQGWKQCKIVAEEWAKKKLKFEKELSSFDYWETLGERLESVAVECGRLAHPFADEEFAEDYQKYRTFTHGDPKQANLFFRSTDDQKKLQVGLIDFQWSGFGLAATDMAHFLTSAVHADMLVDGGEEKLQRYYFAELQKYLVEFGAFDSVEEAQKGYPFSTFLEQYELGVLDICRLMIAYTWARFTEPVEKDDKEGCARTMNKTSYNKSIPTIVWLLSRCDEILKSRGV